MFSLAIDTSTGKGSIALAFGDKSWNKDLSEKGTQAADLVAFIKEGCESFGKHPTDLTHIYCCVGPGSFTGIRIGLTVARILAFTTDAEVVGVHTLDAFALSTDQQAPLSVAINAGKGQAYLQHFGGDLAPEGETQLVPLEEAQADIGNIEQAKKPITIPDLPMLLSKAESLPRKFALEPIYIREPDAEPARPLPPR